MSEKSSFQSDRVADVTKKRFCLDHQGEISEDLGSFVTIRGRTRWICFQCQKNREACLQKKK